MVSDKQFKTVQAHELGYWKSTPYDPTNPWYYYDRAFIPYLHPVDLALEFGCGPVPYLLNHNVRFKKGVAIDPLIVEYCKLRRYGHYWKTSKIIDVASSARHLPDGYGDVTFALNVLDHVQDPEKFLDLLAAKTKGLLFLFTDVDKPPDKMHPHTIDSTWLWGELGARFREELWLVEKSWKFSNNVVYYIGRKR